MTSRRDLLAALVALAATPALARAATPDIFAGLDPGSIGRIGRAWRDQHARVTVRDLAVRLFPAGRGPDALARLGALAAADFRAGKVFTYRGWRLSDTEGALFALLSLEGRP
jgi:hypothetical protein